MVIHVDRIYPQITVVQYSIVSYYLSETAKSMIALGPCNRHNMTHADMFVARPLLVSLRWQRQQHLSASATSTRWHRRKNAAFLSLYDTVSFPKHFFVFRHKSEHSLAICCFAFDARTNFNAIGFHASTVAWLANLRVVTLASTPRWFCFCFQVEVA